MSTPVCFCIDCKREAIRRPSFSVLPAIERYTAQFQEYRRSVGLTSNREVIKRISGHRNSESAKKNIPEPVNPLVNVVKVSTSENNHVATNFVCMELAWIDRQGSLEWIRKHGPIEGERMSNENYVDRNGIEKHYSVLMAKLHLELTPKKKKSLKKRAMDIASSWKKYVAKKIKRSLIKAARSAYKSESQYPHY